MGRKDTPSEKHHSGLIAPTGDESLAYLFKTQEEELGWEWGTGHTSPHFLKPRRATGRGELGIWGPGAPVSEPGRAGWASQQLPLGLKLY